MKSPCAAHNCPQSHSGCRQYHSPAEMLLPSWSARPVRNAVTIPAALAIRQRRRYLSSDALFIDLHGAGIDSLARPRYSQAQIPDLVAHAIPRFRHPAQSFGSALDRARRIPPHSSVSRPPAGCAAGRLCDLFIAAFRLTSTRQRRIGGRRIL
jgi:hypothetical protein